MTRPATEAGYDGRRVKGEKNFIDNASKHNQYVDHLAKKLNQKRKMLPIPVAMRSKV